MKTRCSFLFAALLLAVNVQASAVQVRTESGLLEGSQASVQTRDGASTLINIFKGIPYAQPPVGELRWRPPQPISWDGVYSANEFALPCLQVTPEDGRPNGAGVSGPSSEDCLYLNVWAPANGKNAPVMLWLYGGGGIAGSGHVPSYHGDAFARDGVVLVTINYRLGALAGFAHPALTKAAGSEPFANYHLLDAMAALRWIKNNAAAFGGDPDNITLFGESAGATMVANLLTSPMAKGLFNKAVVQSTGSLPTPGTPLARAEELGVKAVGLLGLDESADASALRALDAQTLIGNRAAGVGLRTIIDGRIKTESILDSFASGTAIDVPLMIGTNSDEGRLRGTQLVATHAQSGAPVWQYFFDYVPEWRRPEQPNGAPHAAEIPYVFDTLSADRRGDEMTARDHAVAARIHSCWLAFAKAGPETRTLECADNFQWPARSDDNDRRVAIFKEHPSLGLAEELRSPPNGAEPGPTSRP